MDINIGKIEEIYGIDILELIKDNINDINENLNYLSKLEFNDIEDIFERYPLIFICEPSEFKTNINNLIHNLGNNYIDIIENDLSILERLL